VITFELHSENLQHYCKDEIEPFLNETAQGQWKWQVEYSYGTDKFGDKIKRKKIYAVVFTQHEDADFFLLKYPNLIK
jgi:hypothetical protein